MLRHQFILELERKEESSPILERIAAVIEVLDAERLLNALDAERTPHGRGDYPNRVLWHCLVAFACLGVRAVTEGLRYLQLSPGLQRLCGIESAGGLPSKHAFYRFDRRLAGQEPLLEEMFAKLLRTLSETLPGFGERLTTDSTKVHSLCNGKKPAADRDASWKKYEHSYQDERGQPRKEENQDLLPENQQRCPDNRELRFDGFERARGALRYDRPRDCPKECGHGRCEHQRYCVQKLIRVKLDEKALRHLGPVPRRSKKFARLYRGRTAGERVNGRLKKSWGLDCVRRRGLKRVQVWAKLALLCMNAFAATLAQAGRLDEVRKTVYTIAA